MPVNLGSKNVDHILIAEFDIDKGSVLKLQYPLPTGEEEQHLAEQMLPDGAHNREQDWTVFFLNRTFETPKSAPISTQKDSISKNKALKPLDAFTHRWDETTNSWIRLGADAETHEIITLSEPKFSFITRKKDDRPVQESNPGPSDSESGDLTAQPKEPESEDPVLGVNDVEVECTFGGEIVISEQSGSPLLVLPIHSDMQFEIIDENFKDSGNVLATVIALDGSKIGFEFFMPDQEKLLGQWTKCVDTKREQDLEHYLKEENDRKQTMSAAAAAATNSNSENDSQQQQQSNSVAATKASEEPTRPILLCLNYVRTKLDRTIKRGARVRAMAICCAHQYSFCFKEVLQYILDAFFDHDAEAIASLTYDFINSIDTSNIPQVSCIKAQANRWAVVSPTQSHTITTPFLVPLPPLPNSPSPPSTTTVFKDSVSKDTTETSASSDSTTTTTTTSVEQPENSHAAIGGSSGVGGDWTLVEESTSGASGVGNVVSVVQPPPKKFKIEIPLAQREDEIMDPLISVVKLVEKFKEQTMYIFNAILEQKRVIFLGYGSACETVCSMVLAACQLVGPPLNGILKRRAFPYANLVNLQFLSVPGFIAGVTNPMFEHRTSWYDLVCDIDSGRVKKGAGATPQHEAPHFQADQEFIVQVLSAITTKTLPSMRKTSLEDYVRNMFQDYAHDIVEMAFSDLYFCDDESRVAAVSTNEERLSKWKMTSSFTHYAEDRQQRMDRRPTQETNLEKHMRKLRVGKGLSESEVLFVLSDFLKYVNSEEQILEFLSLLPECQGGLFPVASLLFHPSHSVRIATVAMLRRLDTIKEGQKCLSALNLFLMLTYTRAERALPKGDLTALALETIDL